MTDVLGRAVIEIGVDELRLQDELGQAQKDMSSSFNETLKRTKLTTSEMSKMAKITGTLQYLDVNRVKLADAQTRSTLKSAKATQFHYDVLKKLNAETFRTRFGSINDPFNPTDRNAGRIRKGAGYLESGLSIAGGVLGAATAGSFAAAAASGSTTLNTLTGSLKSLSLAVGRKVQDDVLNLSEGIQGMAKRAKSVSRSDLYAGGGLLGGAALGYRLGGLKGAAIGAGTGLGAGLFAGGNYITGGAIGGASIGATLAGLPGAIAGALVGALGGALGGLKTQSQYAGDFAERFARNPAMAARALTAAAKLDKQSEKLGGEARQRSQEAAEMLREGVARGEALRATGLDGFKTAGLDMPASYAGLTDVRQQAQMAVFSKGPLEMQNFIDELELNRKALAENTAEVKKKGGTDPNGVAPPLS